MTSPYQRMIELAAAHKRFALATVMRTVGSTPQTVGAKLVLTERDDERPVGTLGGGCVEADAMLAIREVLQHGGRILREYRLTEDLAWNTGLVCGGSMWILAEAGDAALHVGHRDISPEIQQALAGGAPLAIVTRLAKAGTNLSFDSRMVVLADGRRIGTVGDADERAAATALDQLSRGPVARVSLDNGDELVVEPVMARPKLFLAGGGHVAKAIARQAQLLDFDVTIFEDRASFADPARFDGADVVLGDIPASIAACDLRGQSFLVIATRGHKMDADCVQAAVATNVGYIGLLGSRRKMVLIAEMLREAGVDDKRIASIHAPVGLDLGGRTPAEIALSVMAEITQIRYGGSGRSLRASTT